MYNILVCDDERDIVSALRIYLTSEGYKVYEAYNGEEALALIEKKGHSFGTHGRDDACDGRNNGDGKAAGEKQCACDYADGKERGYRQGAGLKYRCG